MFLLLQKDSLRQTTLKLEARAVFFCFLFSRLSFLLFFYIPFFFLRISLPLSIWISISFSVSIYFSLFIFLLFTLSLYLFLLGTVQFCRHSHQTNNSKTKEKKDGGFTTAFLFLFYFLFLTFFFFVSLLVFTPSSLADEGVMATDPVCHEHHYMLTWNEYLKTFTSFQNIEFDKKTVESPLQTLKLSISSFENLFLHLSSMYLCACLSSEASFLFLYSDTDLYFSYLNILSWHFVHLVLVTLLQVFYIGPGVY